MVGHSAQYTAKLQAVGLVVETKLLLQLWQSGMTVPMLYKEALTSGQFPVTARRLRNIVVECFAPRYLSHDAAPTLHLEVLLLSLTSEELHQFLLLFTCRANVILADFIRQVYWPRYRHATDLNSRQKKLLSMHGSLAATEREQGFESPTSPFR